MHKSRNRFIAIIVSVLIIIASPLSVAGNLLDPNPPANPEPDTVYATLSSTTEGVPGNYVDVRIVLDHNPGIFKGELKLTASVNTVVTANPGWTAGPAFSGYDPLTAPSFGNDYFPILLTITGSLPSTDVGLLGTVRFSVPAGVDNVTFTLAVDGDFYGDVAGTALALDAGPHTWTRPAAHVPVTGVTGVPLSEVAGTAIALPSLADPATATNRGIVWSVDNAGTTGATITGGNLNTTAAGTVVIKATVVNGLTDTTDWTDTFSINITAAPAYVLTVADNITGGTVSPSGAQPPVAAGTTMILTLSPATAGHVLSTAGIQVVGVTGYSVAGNVVAFNMPAAATTVTITAEFVAPVAPTYVLTVVDNVTGGTVSPVGAQSAVTAGTSMILILSPATAGHVLSGAGIQVTGVTGYSIAGNVVAFNMPAEATTVTITAEFEPPAYVLTVVDDVTGGTVSPVGAQPAVAAGTQMILILSPETTGHVLSEAGIQVAGVTGYSIAGNVVAFNMPAGATTVTITAEFEPPAYVLTVVDNITGGTVSPVGTQPAVAAGTPVILILSPSTASHILSDAGVEITGVTGYSRIGNVVAFNMPAAATTVTVTAAFVPPADITITWNPNGGTVSPTTQMRTPGEAIGTLPIPTRTGFTFIGWFTTSAVTGGMQITATTLAPNNNVTYWARWTQGNGTRSGWYPVEGGNLAFYHNGVRVGLGSGIHGYFARDLQTPYGIADFFFSNEGHLVRGLVSYGGAWHYFDTTHGTRHFSGVSGWWGWGLAPGQLRYLHANGTLAINQLITITWNCNYGGPSEAKYLFDANGFLITNFDFNLAGGLSVHSAFGEWHVVATHSFNRIGNFNEANGGGWLQPRPGVLRYLVADGTYRTGLATVVNGRTTIPANSLDDVWTTISGQEFLFCVDGYLQFGWVYANGDRVAYIGTNGVRES